MSVPADEWFASDFNVTVQTHRDDSLELRRSLRAACAALGDLDVAQGVFSSIVVTNAFVDEEEIGFELSPVQQKLHAHFELELDHSEEPPLKLTSAADPEGRGVNRRLQDYFNKAIGVDGCYVRAELNRTLSAHKNYKRKTRRAKAREDQLLAVPGLLDRQFDW